MCQRCVGIVGDGVGVGSGSGEVRGVVTRGSAHAGSCWVLVPVLVLGPFPITYRSRYYADAFSPSLLFSPAALGCEEWDGGTAVMEPAGQGGPGRGDWCGRGDEGGAW